MVSIFQGSVFSQHREAFLHLMETGEAFEREIEILILLRDLYFRSE